MDSIDWLTGLSWLYALNNTLLALFGLNLFVLLGLAIWRSRVPAPAPVPPDPSQLPTVLVQLPIYNERHVVERLIDAAAALDYPSDRLLIQVLDDSTDDTVKLAQARVAYHAARGKPIEYRHRAIRAGYKAGALAEGLAAAPGEFVVLFDADFVPTPDFLQRTLPHLLANPRLGILQTRWDHLNPKDTLVTRALALALDVFFMVDQFARSQSGLLMNFNGSAAVLRRACIESSGGWNVDTLVEDADLSYRAQLQGWQIRFRHEIAVPAELPPTILALKQQQFRWAKGSIQILQKQAWRLIRSDKSAFQKFESFLQLCGYLPHPLMVFSLLLSLPVVLLHGQTPLNWGLFGLALLAPPLAVIYSQWILQRDGRALWLYYPAIMLISIGVAVVDTRAVLEGLFGRASAFMRTPKLGGMQLQHSSYYLEIDWSTWVEAGLALYGAGTGWLALTLAPGLAPFIFMYAAGFGLTAALGFWESYTAYTVRLRSQAETEAN